VHISVEEYHKFLACYPTLTSCGFGSPSRIGFDVERSELDDATSEFDYCCEYLATREKSRIINHNAYSYRLLREVEHWIDKTLSKSVDISEGSFIAAAIYMGFDYQKIVKQTGVYLNLVD
jgi:hypothetical protein